MSLTIDDGYHGTKTVREDITMLRISGSYNQSETPGCNRVGDRIILPSKRLRRESGVELLWHEWRLVHF